MQHLAVEESLVTPQSLSLLAPLQTHLEYLYLGLAPQLWGYYAF